MASREVFAWEKELQVCEQQEHHYNHQLQTLLECLRPQVWLIAFSMCDLPFPDLVWLVLMKLTMR